MSSSACDSGFEIVSVRLCGPVDDVRETYWGGQLVGIRLSCEERLFRRQAFALRERGSPDRP